MLNFFFFNFNSEISNQKNDSSISHSSSLNKQTNINAHKFHPITNGLKILNEWYWDNESKSECISLSSDHKTAYFFDNPFSISRGTAGCRGSQPVTSGVYYFEILVKEPLYGTAVMIGYGTDEVQLHYENFDYVHLVGKDSNSWGLSHKGFMWHNGKSKHYCEPFFDKDVVIGVLLNTYTKTLEYFLDGEYLGVAFRDMNIENKKLYPMISSTATDVELELVNSFKIIYSLEDLCYQSVCRSFKDYDSLPIAKRQINHLKNFAK